MFKKVVLGTLLLGLIAVLTVGAVVRTVAKSEQVTGVTTQARGHGQSQGQGQDQEANTRQSNVSGSGRGSGQSERRYPNNQDAPSDWVDVEGIVVQSPQDGVDLLIETADGSQLQIGTGPNYMASQGFVLQTGEQIQVQGYWENGELKASQLTRLHDGVSIALRDELGRPAWAGAGRRARANNVSLY